MPKQYKFLAPLTILMGIIVLVAAATWVVPAGIYSTLSYKDKQFIIVSPDSASVLPFSKTITDSLHISIPLKAFENGDISKPVSIPGSYHRLKKNPQGIVSILQAPIKGIYETIDIILFVLLLGSFINIFYASGAIEKGIARLCYKMKGRETWLIISLSLIFIAGGTTYGMDAEAMAFYPILVPVFLAAGYDLIVPLAVIFLGTQIGQLSSVSNPFSSVIASNILGINWINGITQRIIICIITAVISIVYLVRYAQKVKRNPQRSILAKSGSNVQSPYPVQEIELKNIRLSNTTIFLLILFALTFIIMIAGVIFFKWWLPEMSAVFLGATIVFGIILRMPENVFVEKFITGAASLLGVSLIIGVARGVTIVMNEGNISDSLLYHSSMLVGSLPPALFIVVLMTLYLVFTVFIASTSGMAVVTMPILGSLALMLGVPGHDTVNAYLFGLGIMNLISPTGLLLPSLALVNVSFGSWLKFITPLLIILYIVCAVFLVISLLLS
ncbi:MAG TPA: hypothetical protein VM101_13200 [Flavitalea sp.]|nr:hypothetical protein [Flavitalea sp.]